MNQLAFDIPVPESDSLKSFTPLFLDTETTSNGSEENRMIQLSYKTSGDLKHDALYKPPVDISFEAMAVHNITSDMVADKPSFAASGDREQLQKLLETHIIVAHNAEFDIGVLRSEGIKVDKYICTRKVGHRLLEIDSRGKPLSGYSMQYLRYALDIDVPGAIAHDAWGDILVLEQLYNYLEGKALESEDFPNTKEELINEFVAISTMPILLKKLRFGKYRGRTFEEITATDREYLTWLAGQSDLDADLRFTLKHHLSKSV